MKPFQPTWESVKTHTLPDWYNDCKLGIFIHWGLYSVPAWAEVTWELGEQQDWEAWFRHNPYAEWYLNSIRLKDSAAWQHHSKTYGADFPYSRFTEQFTCKNYNPDEWASLFKDAGAKYVVLTTKHHDGFCLYPSKYTDYNSQKLGPERDLMGELTNAVRGKGLRMGAYYSGLLDWTTIKEPIGDGTDVSSLYNRTYAFADYSYNQAMELVDLYKPSILWNDIGWPEQGISQLPSLFSHYYNSVSEGVVNDRWSGAWQDYATAEYKTGTRSLQDKWEMCRGLGLSFGYNINEGDETVVSAHKLVRMLAEFVSHNGNLLINVGPRADGTIPEIQASRLRALGAWLKINGEGIYGTRPWEERQHDELPGGVDVFYTRKGPSVYAIVDGLNKGTHKLRLPFMGEDITLECPDDMPVMRKLTLG